MTGPLFYSMYAAWGSVAGFGPASLRILSMVFSLAAFLLIYHLYRTVLRDMRYVLAGMAVLLINPYMTGLGFHVFTDIPAVMFLVLAAIALRKGRRLLLFAATACALLVRHYSVFMLAAALVFLLTAKREGAGPAGGETAALLAGAIPMMIMLIVWKGPAPASGIEKWVVDDGSVYRFRYIFIYVTFMAVYALPLVLVAWRALVRWKNVLAALPLSLFSIFLPVGPSLATVRQTGLPTVGLAHRLLTAAAGSGAASGAFLWLFCWLGFTVLIGLFRLDLRRSGAGADRFGLLMTLSVVSFLLVMPFSYQVWEKYLVMIMPFFGLRLLMAAGTGAARD